MAKPQYIQKISQSPADTLLPCIIDQWQHSFPMDTTWNTMMKPDRVANICHNGIYNGMSNAILTRDSKWFSIRKKKNGLIQIKLATEPLRLILPPPFFFSLFELRLNTPLFPFRLLCDLSLSLPSHLLYGCTNKKKKKRKRRRGSNKGHGLMVRARPPAFQLSGSSNRASERAAKVTRDESQKIWSIWQPVQTAHLLFLILMN